MRSRRLSRVALAEIPSATLVYQPVTMRNLEATVHFKAVDGSIDRAGGLAVRVINADKYYVVRANALEDDVRFYRMVNGRREHTLGLRAQGDRFAVTFDGASLFTAVDGTFADAGNIALWTKVDSVTAFDGSNG